MADGVNVDGLRQFYTENAVARTFLDHAAQRERDLSETSVDRTLAILKEHAVESNRAEVVALFQRLEKLGCGQFIIGRRGRPSRLAWSASIVSIGKAAVGEQHVVAELPPTTTTVVAPDDEMLSHSYHLRLGVTVVFELPADLTPSEAERLAGFIKTLPMSE
jgi:hypothetical protein